MKPSPSSIFALPQPVPFVPLALMLCLLFAGVGAAVLDDYGVSEDEISIRLIGMANIRHIMGDHEVPEANFGHLHHHRFHDVTFQLPPLSERTDVIKIQHHYRFYGVAFQLPLLLIERILGLQDSRDIFLTRHLLTHLFFLLGGFSCGLLAHRMFGSRALAVLAMLLFLLHPRLYAHSFFNSKDLPFAAMFMISLFLIHRAFRRETPGAFALCGLGVGLAIGMRPFGLLLLPAVLGMRALDLWSASGRLERRRVLGMAGVFAAVALATMYAAHPYLWANPLQFFEGIQVLSQNPNQGVNLFRGELIASDALPPHYIPTWFAITAPPLTLLLGGIGAAAVCWQGFLRPDGLLRNGELRFRTLLLVCVALPVVAVVLMQASIYNGWRLVYFLWAPFSLLAVVGFKWLKEWPGRAGNRRSATLHGAICLGLACVLIEMASLHPHQQVYFNLLVDRRTPGDLGQRYDTEYWYASFREALEHLRERHPDAGLHVWGSPKNRLILPQFDRKRLLMKEGRSPDEYHDFYIATDRVLASTAVPTEPVVQARRAYASNVYSIVAPRLVWGTLWPDADTYRAAHRSLVVAQAPAASAAFDLYFQGGALHFVKESCKPADVAQRFFLHIIPVQVEDLPLRRRKHGFENRDFPFSWRGGFFDGKCMTQAPLPDYPIARIRTGQFVRGEGQIWKAELPIGG